MFKNYENLCEVLLSSVSELIVGENVVMLQALWESFRIPQTR